MKATPPPPKSLKGLAEQPGDNGVSKSTTTFFVDLGKLEIDPDFNARPINRAHVDEMKEAKRNGAFFPPYVVRVDNGHVKVIEGHHRRIMDLELVAEAAHGDPLKDLRANCIEFKGDDADRVMLMLGSTQGLPLTPLELGVQYKKMIGYGWNAPKIAGRVGKSDQHVRDMIELANSTSDVQFMVISGEVSANTALKVVKKEGDGAGKILSAGLQAAKDSGRAKVTQKALRPAASTVMSVKDFDALLNQLCDAAESEETTAKDVQALFDKVVAAFAAAKGAK